MLKLYFVELCPFLHVRELRDPTVQLVTLMWLCFY